MISNPTILSLLAGSLLSAAMVLYSARIGVQVLRRWDLKSGSEEQLLLERKTYLASTLLTYLFVFQLVSLFLFVYTADSLCHLLVGAMCAAGTLNVNGFGYPALIVKIGTFLLAGMWLLLNHLDRQGRDYPLVRVKYGLLLGIAPLLLVEVGLQGGYFLGLEPDVITSCCGTLFGTGARTVGAQLATLPPGPSRAAFFATEVAVIAAGLWVLIRGSGGYGFSILAGLAFAVGMLSAISFISLYVYQMPSHHCPFCVLQAEYGWAGYPLYGLILFGGLSGVGSGMLRPFRSVPSLHRAAPGVLRHLTWVSVVCHLLLLAGVAALITTSEMRLLP